MKHVFAIKVEGDQLQVLPQRWDSAQQMMDELPDGEYLVGGLTMINAETRAEKQAALTDFERQQKEAKDKRKALLEKQAKELQDQIAAMG